MAAEAAVRPAQEQFDRPIGAWPAVLLFSDWRAIVIIAGKRYRNLDRRVMASEIFNVLVFEHRCHERHHVVLTCAGAVIVESLGEIDRA